MRLPTLLLSALLALAPGPGRGAEPLYVVERDTLQTRNFVPIVNHEVLLVNLGARPLVFDLSSAVPRGKWRRGPHWPAFLEESQLPDPMFSPLDVSPTKTTFLPRPEVVENKADATLHWKGVTLPPGEAAVGQYDSWFGEAGQFWSKDGLALPGLRIRCTGALAVKGQRVDVTFAYELENLAASPIDDLAVEVFVPLKVFLDAGETTLLEAAEIAASPNVTTSQTTRADGLGRAASGVAGGYFGGTLAKGGKVRFHLRVSARLKAKGIVWPLLSVRGRALSERVWPETQIRLAEPVNTGRFAYLSYNLVVPDSRVLDLRRAGAAFLPATTMTRSGAR